jgi:hypothetical protein
MKTNRMAISTLLGILAAMLLADFAWAVDCGGSGATKVPCSCGDTVVASTTLVSPNQDPVNGDPVVSTNDNDVCTGDGLIITTAKVNVSLNSNQIRGSGLGVGVGIKILGVNLDQILIRNGLIKGFETGIATSAGSSTNRLTIRKITVNENALLGINVAGNNTTADSIEALGNGDTGVRVAGDGTTLLFVRSSQNGNHGIDVLGAQSVVRSGQVNRNIGNGIQVMGDNSALDHNLATKNFDGIMIVGNGDGNPATLELVKNKATGNEGHGITVAGNNHEIAGNQANTNDEDGIAVAGTGNHLDTNVARENKGNGIIVTGGGNFDDGGNLGKKNGDVQCQIDGQACLAN